MLNERNVELRGSTVGAVNLAGLQFLSLVDESKDLKVNLRSLACPTQSVTVQFDCVEAYRVADEGILLTYWAAKAANTSHLIWELTGSEFLAWIEKFSFGAVAVEDGIRHFIVVTDFKCIEVLTKVEPIITLRGY